jgi:hypothetical protein
MIRDTININGGARGGPVAKHPRDRHTISADIGYGEGVGPGGYKYCLDLATRYTWVYGLSDLSGDCLIDALWRFFVDAGGFPKRFRCDFDWRFLHGKVCCLLRSHGAKIGASPPIVILRMAQLKEIGIQPSKWDNLTSLRPIFQKDTGSGQFGRSPCG